MEESQLLQKKANIIRALCLLSTSQAGSGHPTSCFSAADLTTVLFDKYFLYDLQNPKNLGNDRFIISKGHVAPLYYALFAAAGGLKREELLTLRKFKSRLEGHPTPRFIYADFATGSLGQGLSIAAGVALVMREEIPSFAKASEGKQISPKVYVLLGDGELAEGQNYEAVNFASQNSLDNLIAIADINGFGQTGKTAYFHDTEHYNSVFSSHGFKTLVIDGHNFSEIQKAFEQATSNTTGKPFMIIASTEKGKGVSFVVGREDFHGKAIGKDDVEKALGEIGVTKEQAMKDEVLFQLKKPEDHTGGSVTTDRISPVKDSIATLQNDGLNSMLSSYKLGEEYATREVFGEVLAELGKLHDDIYVVDGDVGNSTFTEKFKKAVPGRFVQSYIAEQNMVGVAVGLSSLGKKPFVATFGAFLTRAYDQIRMGRIGCSNIAYVGSHSGVSIGEDGPSQMALEDIAMFAPIPDSVILHPSDAVSCAKLLPQIYDYKGISYLRTLRPKTKVLYGEEDKFAIGGSKILRSAGNDILVIVACGITVFEALAAYEELKKENISICVIDAYSLKPLDSKTIMEHVEGSMKKTIVTVEDHYYHGGLGDMVAAEMPGYKVLKLAVKSVPFSGDKDSLLKEFGIDKSAIISAVKQHVQA